MNQRELKRKLYELISTYYGEATVVWGRTKKVRPGAPLVTLDAGSVLRPYHPIEKVVNGVPVASYQSATTVQVDLFTKGDKLTEESGVTAEYDNTAVSDMLDFVNFLQSLYVGDWCLKNDISIMVNQVQDLTELINDTTWDYRAMVELEIGFTQYAIGYAGIGQNVPNSSGGGTKELADEDVGWFEQVEIDSKEV